MNKLFTKIATAFVGMAMAIGVGVAVGNRQQVKKAEALSNGSYTLTFDQNTANDGSGDHATTDATTAFTTSNFATYGTYSYSNSGTKYWLLTGYSNIQSVTSSSYTYPGKNQTLKMGGRKGDSTLAFSVKGSTALYITSVVVNAYGDNNKGKATYMAIAEATAGTKKQTLTTSEAEYTFEYASAVKTVTFTVGGGLGSDNPNAWVSSIVINYSIPTYISGIQLSGTGLGGTSSAATLDIASSDSSGHVITAIVNNADDMRMTVTNSDSSVAVVSGLSDGKITASLVEGQYKATFTVTGQGLSSGSTTITIAAVDAGGVSATLTITAAGTIYTISTTTTNGTSSGDSSIRAGDTASIVFSADAGYKLPTDSSSFSVSNATISSWTRGTGVLVIGSATGNVTITVSMVAKTNYTITVTNTNCTFTGASNILEESEATITFTANGGCALPSSVTVSNASYEWNQATGVLTLSNPTNNVSVSVSATVFVNETSLISGRRYYILNNDKTKGLSAAATDSSPAAVTLATNNATTNAFNAFDATLVGDNTFTFSVTSGGKTYYLVNNSAGSGNTNIRVVESSAFADGLKSHSWILKENTGADVGTYSVKEWISGNVGSESYKILSYYSGGSDWRGYTGASGDQKITFVEEGTYADQIATALLSNSLCNGGTTAPSTSTWNTIASTTYITNEKNILKNTVATARNPLDGSASSGDNRADAMARYDYIVGKYGKSTYADFLGRDPSAPAFAHANIALESQNNNTVTMLVVVISFISLTAIGGFFFIKKRKEQ